MSADAEDILKQMREVNRKAQEEKDRQAKEIEEKEKEEKKGKPPKKSSTPKTSRPKPKLEEEKIDDSQLAEKINKIISDNPLLQEIIANNKIIEDKVEKLVQERTKSMIKLTQLIDVDVEEEIAKLIEDKRKAQVKNKKPVTEIQVNDVLSWLAEKINENPTQFSKDNPTFLKLFNRLFDEAAFKVSFNDQAKKIIPYEPRYSGKGKKVTGKKPGGDVNLFQTYFEMFKQFLFDQYADLIQLDYLDYAFFKDLFEIFTRHLVQKFEETSQT